MKTEHKNLKIKILFEDKYLCVIEKPAGLLSVPASGKEKSALTILEEIMRKKGTFSKNHRPFAVHRLDRDTSGVMMFALTENAQKRLMDGWHKIVSERLYRAIAENPRNPKNFLPDSGLIDDDLAFNAYNVGFVPKKTDEKNSIGGQNSRNARDSFGENNLLSGRDSLSRGREQKLKTVPARTHFTTILRGKTHTLFELSLDTGKKNQIRAHLASKGYPLAGDKNFRAKTDHFDRLCLHARTLEFTHPFTEKKMRFEIPEPAEWKIYVEKGDFSADTAKVPRQPASNRRVSSRNRTLFFEKRGRARVRR